MQHLTCFKAYDIRGRVPDELSEDLAYKIGVSYAHVLSPRTVIVGHDARLESPSLTKAVSCGLSDAGVNVINIGLCGTEEVYFQTFHRESKGVDGGIMVTASHNPKGYNGMKLVRRGSVPISNDSGLLDIRHYIENAFAAPSKQKKEGLVSLETDKTEYISHLLSYINIKNLKPLKIVVNPGNGSAGPVLKLLEQFLPFNFIYMQEKPDGHFPQGVPNPMIKENQYATAEAVRLHKADLGIAWDGDFDRCFLYTETGEFIEGYYIVGLLAEAFLKKFPQEKIIHDTRLIWNTEDIVRDCSGTSVQSKAGHAFIKERMREENAIYGGEMSSHHYFRDFAYCDSGMIPWLLVVELMSLTGKKLSQMVTERIDAYPCSGEINFKVKNTKEVTKDILIHFAPLNPKIDYIDGVSLDFTNWRFNLRPSNTEPLLRLNVETRGSKSLLKERFLEISKFINQYLDVTVKDNDTKQK